MPWRTGAQQKKAKSIIDEIDGRGGETGRHFQNEWKRAQKRGTQAKTAVYSVIIIIIMPRFENRDASRCLCEFVIKKKMLQGDNRFRLREKKIIARAPEHC